MHLRKVIILLSITAVSLPQLPCPAQMPPWPTCCGSNRPQGAGHHTPYQTSRLLLSGAHGPDPTDLQLGNTIILHRIYFSFRFCSKAHIEHSDTWICSTRAGFIDPPFWMKFCAALNAFEASTVGMWMCLTTGKMLRTSSGPMGALFWLSKT